MSWSNVLEFIKTIWPSIVGAVKLLAAARVGQSVASGEAAKRELESVQRAQHAVDGNLLLSTDERLRDATKRRLYRVSSR
jgi:hypothetical protein